MSDIIEPVYKVDTYEHPQSVKIFRKVISKFKRKLFNNLESSELDGNKEAQHLERLQDVINYITSFGNILMKILKTKENVSDEIIKLFNENGLDLLNLSYREREICMHYVNTDIHTYPYDLNGHTVN
jgi:hypothetical protein